MTNDRPYLLDVTRLVWRRWVGRLPTGIDRVCLAYLEQFGSQSQAVIHRRGFRRILSVAASDRLFALLAAPRSGVRGELAAFLAREALRYSNDLAGRGRIYFNVGHTALHEPAYLAWTRAADVRAVYMIHDLIPITHPEYCRAGEGIRHAARVRHMLQSAAGIIGNSRDTLDVLSTFAAANGLAVPSMIAAPLGTNLTRPARGPEPSAGRATFVMLGTIEGRKNHLLLLQVWARLVALHGIDAPRLLIIGQRGWECEQVVDLLERSASLREAVVEVGRCSDAELQRHLHDARALLFPTLVEGYGLPLVEALASGTPVIASDIPVFREIGGGIPDFLDPLDGPAWQAAILAYAEADSMPRAAQVERLKTYRPPSWADHFVAVRAWADAL